MRTATDVPLNTTVTSQFVVSPKCRYTGDLGLQPLMGAGQGQAPQPGSISPNRHQAFPEALSRSRRRHDDSHTISRAESGASAATAGRRGGYRVCELGQAVNVSTYGHRPNADDQRGNDGHRAAVGTGRHHDHDDRWDDVAHECRDLSLDRRAPRSSMHAGRNRPSRHSGQHPVHHLPARLHGHRPTAGGLYRGAETHTASPVWRARSAQCVRGRPFGAA